MGCVLLLLLGLLHNTLWFSLLLLLFILVDLNLGFGLQDNWGEGNGCPFPELDLNNIIPSGQMDMKSPPVESLDTSITGSSFSEQRMTQGSVPEQLNTPVPGEDMPLYGLLGS